MTKEQLKTMRKEIVISSQRLYPVKWLVEAVTDAAQTVEELDAIDIVLEMIGLGEKEGDGQTAWPDFICDRPVRQYSFRQLGGRSDVKSGTSAVRATVCGFLSVLVRASTDFRYEPVTVCRYLSQTLFFQDSLWKTGTTMARFVRHRFCPVSARLFVSVLR